MSSHFLLELDTTSPAINIFSPSYVTRESDTEVIVQSNEPLSSFQDITIMDSEGIIRKYTFLYNEKLMRYTGNISFNEFAYGEATIYVRVSDTVDNVSEVSSKTVMVRESLSNMTLIVDDKARKVTSRNEQKGKTVTKTDILNKVSIDELLQEVNIQDKSRRFLKLNQK